MMTWFSDRFTKYRILIVIVALVGVLGGLLWFFGYVDKWWFDRGVRKDKEAIKEQLSNIAVKEEQIANLRVEVAEEKVKAAEAVKDLAAASNATDQAKNETNKALANLNAARNSNQTNTSVEDLQKLLDKLDQ